MSTPPTNLIERQHDHLFGTDSTITYGLEFSGRLPDSGPPILAARPTRLITPSPRTSCEPPPSTFRPGWMRRLWGSLLTFIGFMLSPLSWWNDLFVNVPLAIGFAWVVSLFYPPAFKAAVVIGYALTNVLGFVLLHIGIGTMAGKLPQRHLGRDAGLALLYTGVVLVLVHLGILQPIEACLATK